MTFEEWERSTDFAKLERLAERIVGDCVESLPPLLKSKAKRVPCLIRKWHPDVEAGHEEAMYMLGEYLQDDDEGLREPSGVIAIYVAGIALFCEEEGMDFEEEVQRTYFHELGHHFGWDEDDLADRGLD